MGKSDIGRARANAMLAWVVARQGDWSGTGCRASATSPAIIAGFNGIIESEYLSIARLRVEDKARFSIFKDRDLNSRRPASQAYRGMLELFLPIRATLAGRHLSADEVIALLRARIHPDLRWAIGRLGLAQRCTELVCRDVVRWLHRKRPPP